MFKLLETKKVLVLDGATATELSNRGLNLGLNKFKN
jgi:S-methylmethionine-dependent homocysteine/selenocysteine methylase